VPVAIERSRSGNGAHAWIFFSEPIAAAEARRLEALLVAATMDRYPDIGFDSYDRFFPSQDTTPAGGFGNLIALPLQSRPRASGNIVFLDDEFHPCQDQWAYLSTIERLSRNRLMSTVGEAAEAGQIIGITIPSMMRMTSRGLPRQLAVAKNRGLKANYRHRWRSYWAIRSTLTAQSFRQGL
jgi:hypothetical protein